MYDFTRCKLCGQQQGEPLYRLRDTTVYACSGCGFHFIDALDDLEASGARPLDDRGRGYIEKMLGPNQVQQRHNLAMVERHVSIPGTRSLDIGAGAGMFCHLIKEAGATGEGVEPQLVFREFAAEKFQLDLKRDPLEEQFWDSSAGCYGIITAWDLVEHVNFPRELLQRAVGLLAPGGWLFIDTPSRDSFFYRSAEWLYRLTSGKNSRPLETIYSPRPFRHKQIFSQMQLKGLLESSGLETVEMRSGFFGSKMVVACRKPEHDREVRHA